MLLVVKAMQMSEIIPPGIILFVAVTMAGNALLFLSKGSAAEQHLTYPP
jgi:hypothetical protein